MSHPIPSLESALTAITDSPCKLPPESGTNGTLPNRAGKPRRQWVRVFLAELARTGNVTRSARRAGVGRRWVYKKYHACDNFRQAWVSAEERFADRVEEEIARRAVAGWEEPVFQGGKQVGTRQRYDGRLLLELARSLRPSKWGRTATLELSGPGGVAIPVHTTSDPSFGLTSADLESARMFLAKIAPEMPPRARTALLLPESDSTSRSRE